MEAVMVISAIALFLAFWIVPVGLGVRAAMTKGVSPHWMWFGLHPFGAWIAFLVIRFGVRPRIRCPKCAEKLMSHAKVCAYCGHLFDGMGRELEAQPAVSRRTWIIVGAVVAGTLTLMGAFAMTAFAMDSGISDTFDQNAVVHQALTRAQTDIALQARLGAFIEKGKSTSGTINESGPTGSADIEIPLHGSKGQGDLYAVASKSAGIWSFTTLAFQPDGSSDRIDLLKEPSPAASSLVSK